MHISIANHKTFNLCIKYLSQLALFLHGQAHISCGAKNISHGLEMLPVFMNHKEPKEFRFAEICCVLSLFCSHPFLAKIKSSAAFSSSLNLKEKRTVN